MTSVNTFSLVAGIIKGQFPKFVSFVYRAEGTGELARHNLIIGSSIEDLYKQDVSILDTMIPTLSGLPLEAAQAIRKSRLESLTVGIGNNSAYTNKDTYKTIEGFPNIKFHVETGEVYVSGLSQSKQVLEKGTYKVVQSRPLTLAKREISKSLPSDKFRTFRLDKVVSANIAGETLELNTQHA